ncbi:MAG: Xaa-Pro peptidase family protein, partial [Pseudomonadota bacterium]
MHDTPGIFPASEFENRTARFQSEMAQRGMDALLLTTPPDVFYVTGFLTRFWESPARPWFVIVPARGEPVAVIPAIGEPPMARTWITDIRTWEAPNPNDSGMTLLGDALRDLVPDTGYIGTPMGLETHLRMPLADYQYLCGVLGQRTLIDATACVQRVREIKSEAEVAKLRNICEIGGRAFDQVPQFAQPGTSLEAVFRAFQVACLQQGADWVSYLAGAAGPSGYSDVISPAGTRPIANGDILMLDTGAVRDGYFCDFDRNYAIGKPSAETTRAHEALWRATEDALAAIRPGMRACDVHQLLCQSLVRHGAEPGVGRLGHGLGVSLTEWPSLSADDETPLRAGMVLTLEPGAVLDQGRM